MKVKRLILKNIGPFIDANMLFSKADDDPAPAILITGENGTGKSIILDAIRGVFGKEFCQLNRNIARVGSEDSSKINIVFTADKETIEIESTDIFNDEIKSQRLEKRRKSLKNNKYQPDTPLISTTSTGDIAIAYPQKHISQNSEEWESHATPQFFSSILQKLEKGGHCPNWVVDYWSSAPADGSYNIGTLKTVNHPLFLANSLQGTKKAADIVHLMCHFDYLRDSRDPEEKRLGENLYEILEKIVESSLLDGGKLSHISRSNYRPIIVQNGVKVSLENLSGGNTYLINNMISLLSKMYCIHFLRKTPLEALCSTPGILLIDEAENQLHPKWQKRFISTVLDIFPNLQIIATTHSPFIISSVSEARLFLCKAEKDHCRVVDETAAYRNKPVDEILMSPLFEETNPFNEEISRMLKERKKAVESGDAKTRNEIEKELKAFNPEYFAYFDLDALMEDVKSGDTE